MQHARAHTHTHTQTHTHTHTHRQAITRLDSLVANSPGPQGATMWEAGAPDPGGERRGLISNSLPLASGGVEDDEVLRTPSHGQVLGVYLEPRHSSDAYRDAQHSNEADSQAHQALRVPPADLGAADWDPACGQGGREGAGEGGEGRGLGVRCTPVPKIQFSSRRKSRMSPGVSPPHCLPCCCR